MIFDTIKNCEIYYGIDSRFEKAFDFIKKAVSEKKPEGKYEIEGESLFAVVQEYTTKDTSEAKLEAHRKYIDIQFIDTGIEDVEMQDISHAETCEEYNCEKDVEFFKDSDKIKKCPIGSGEYGIFFPQDVHKPGLVYNGEKTAVRKILVKIACK